jgi:hypothetical protein
MEAVEKKQNWGQMHQLWSEYGSVLLWKLKYSFFYEIIRLSKGILY